MGAGNWTGWTDDILEVLRVIGLSKGDQFTLADVYLSENLLKRLHPNNNNITAKIRQQLQILQDFGVIQFVDNNGLYVLVKNLE
jgi:type II restriction enzyme